MARVMKSEGDGKHPSSHYLVVEDSTKPSTWHLRVRNTQGEIDPRLLGAAWAALHEGYRGNRYQGPNKMEALAKLKRLYERVGRTPPGMAKKAQIFYKDASGDKWFVGIYSNNFQDTTDEIITWDAHKEYIDWLNTTGVKPPIIIGHQPMFPDEFHLAHFLLLKTKSITPEQYNKNLLRIYKHSALAQAEVVYGSNGFVLVAGRVFPEMEHKAKAIEESGIEWGMSHGFLYYNKSGNILNRYRAYEFTTLPVIFAANELTMTSFREVFDMDKKERTELSKRAREIMSDILKMDQEKADDSMREAHSIISEFLASKETPEEETEVTEETEVEVETEETEEAEVEGYAEIRARVFADLNVEGLVKQMTHFDEKIAELTEQLATAQKSLEALGKQVEKTEDEVVTQAFTPMTWAFSERSIAENRNEAEDEKLLNELKTRPATTDKTPESEVMKIGFWNFINQ